MTLVTFADLTHTGKVIDANQFPLATGFVAATLEQAFPDTVETHLFKMPSEFATFLEDREPRVACFSNYMWHENLHQAFATRLKQRYPKAITVFGGPNFPTEAHEQQAFLEKHPEIDFYIDGEGEVPFLDLFTALRELDFDADAFKQTGTPVANLRYQHNGHFVTFPLRPRIKDIENTIPSPYLSGKMDKFFDAIFTPLMETARGCPYTCTFCHSGSDYESKVRRFSQERITAELRYMADRVSVPSLCLADLNWGSFKDDLITAQQLADLRAETNWPRSVHHSTAKNQRDRMVEISSILGDAIIIGATVQSTDPDVLKNVKRSNIAIEKSVEMARASSKNGSSTFTEIILCLPGDTYEKHIKSVLTMMDSGIDEAAIYQFILLPGTEAADTESRQKFGYETRFRIMPRCIGSYPLFGEDLKVLETHEICVANNTMPYEDYKKCRSFSLTISIFNNGNVFEEIFGLAEAFNIPKSKLIWRIHEEAMNKIAEVYDAFHEDEERNLFSSQDEIERFITQEDTLEKSMNGYYGANQIYKFRAIALVERLKDIVNIAISALARELKDAGSSNPLIQTYLAELKEFVFLRKANPFDVDGVFEFSSQFDFETIEKYRFIVQPADYHINTTTFDVGHSKDKIADLRKFFTQYGANMDGLTYFLHRHPARLMYRLATRPRIVDGMLKAQQDNGSGNISLRI
jgi:radical SAM superfamily enzyme YgiQ (UPF0313 family)